MLPLRPFALRLLPLLIPCVSLLAQTEPQPTTFSRDSDTGAFTISFDGVPGRTYFFLYSEDLLQPWGYLPVIESGAGAPISYGLMFSDPPPPRLFVRLRHTDQPHGGDPYAADFDGDGIPSGWEVAHGLDPFSANDAAGDTDGDGITNFAEHQAGTSPLFRDANELGLEIYTP